MVTAAGPYLTRGVRRFDAAVVALLIPTEMYLGVALPRSIVTALVLGWGVGAAIHLAFGSPGGRPTPAQVEAALHDLGVVAADDVRLAPVQSPDHTVMHAQDGSAGLVVKVLGRDERDAKLRHQGLEVPVLQGLWARRCSSPASRRSSTRPT